MFSVHEMASPRQFNNRRSFSNSIMSSIDTASSKLSLSLNSGHRSASVSTAHGENDDPRAFSSSLSAYATYQPVSSPDLPSPSIAIPNSAEPLLQRPMDRFIVRKACTEEIEESPAFSTRPSSALSVHDELGNSSRHSQKWYRRFSRTSSANKLSKAPDSPESNSSSTAAPKLYNPFSRRRSIPIVPRTKQTILGQTAKKAIETGGHASCASELLPTYLLPLLPIEVPYIVDTCIAWLLEHDAHKTPGIFRINGSDKAVRALIDHFSSGSVRMPLDQISFADGQLTSVHDVASCLKKFLVLMPGGLLGESAFESLAAIFDESTSSHPDVMAKDIGEVFQLVKDRPKFQIVLVVMALLRSIADESKLLANADNTAQDSGYMTNVSLGIVFAPTCLGTKNGPFEMRRSSTSYSDRSLQSDSTTPIEEAVAVARLGAKVIQMLINCWPDVVPHLANQGEFIVDESVKMLGIVSVPGPGRLEPSVFNGPLQTILDSPNKENSSVRRKSAHTRTQSIDTVTQRRRCDCESTLLIKDAQLDLQQSKIEKLENANAEALQALAEKSEENARLFARLLALERENLKLLASSPDIPEINSTEA